ncbi:hypothetical protein B0T25DRAFT_53445 [Lasiosphaeria hispida]|uniref:Uncharacterized protein n=1 Tax=Lasiosphaeria hispida TaxID=260671 RepID=A0AAJ0HW80_9PEZI|nr:hypothetical protein B0T25DRAFT_53445 [Lasiosphaeria hispida]
MKHARGSHSSSRDLVSTIRVELQHPAGSVPDMDIRVRVERRATSVEVAGDTVTAEDDGGICRMERAGPGWMMENPSIAIVEAKRVFKEFCFSEKTGDYIPVISNENLAQYVGEAVITWKGNPGRFQDGIFLIAATSSFVRFIHFRFGQDYMDYLNIEDEDAQKEFVIGRDAFVFMRSTKFFNLQSSEGRRAALCHIFALLRWHDKKDGSQQGAGIGESLHPMAEFASALVELAAAGAKVGGSLYHLIHTIKDAPSEFLALSDEITDFRSILSRLLDITASEDTIAIGGGQVEDLNKMRLRGEQIVAEIEVLVAKVRKEGRAGEKKGGTVRKVQWLRHIGQADKLRERLRAQKTTICNVVALGIM